MSTSLRTSRLGVRSRTSLTASKERTPLTTSAQSRLLRDPTQYLASTWARPSAVAPVISSGNGADTLASGPVRVLQAVRSGQHGIKVVYSDGSSHDFKYIWLRDNCRCSACYDPKNAFRQLDTWSLDPQEVHPLAVWVTEDGHLGVKWPDSTQRAGHRSVYEANWLKDNGGCFTERTFPVQEESMIRPPPVLWDAQIMQKQTLPEMAYGIFMRSEEGVMKWLKMFYQYGFVILKDVPLDREALEEVAQRIAYVRETAFGHTADVKVGPGMDIHPSYGGSPLNPHTDLSFRERAPGILMLHCIESADPIRAGRDAGGETILADGFHIAEWLKDKNPSAFEILTTVPVPFAYEDPFTKFRYSSYWPTITLDPQNKIQEIHYSNYARQAPKMPGEMVMPFYTAYRVFSKKLMDPSSQIRFYLTPGDLLAVHNRRLLHGRTGFDIKKVTRYMRTCYTDLDEAICRFDAMLAGKLPEENDKSDSENEGDAWKP